MTDLELRGRVPICPRYVAALPLTLANANQQLMRNRVGSVQVIGESLSFLVAEAQNVTTLGKRNASRSPCGPSLTKAIDR